MRAVALICLLAGPAVAQNLDCQTRGYCTNDLECFPDGERFELRMRPDGRGQFGWVDGTPFEAKPIRRGAMTVYHVTDGAEAVQSLIVGPDGDATFTVAGVFGGRLYHSIQSLTCTEPR